jgi:hypothetical protein
MVFYKFYCPSRLVELRDNVAAINLLAWGSINAGFFLDRILRWSRKCNARKI